MTTHDPPHHTEPVNVSARLRRMAERLPYQRAVVAPVGQDAKGRVTYAHMTFRQLDEVSDRLAHGLESIDGSAPSRPWPWPLCCPSRVKGGLGKHRGT